MSMGVKSWVHSDNFVYKEPEQQDYEEPELYRSLTNLWPKWHTEAACLGVDERMFFGSARPDERPAYTKADIRRAKLTCLGCPVFETCLRQCFANREVYGVWAGTTMRERTRYYREIDLEFYTIEDVVVGILEMRDREREQP